MTTMYVALIFVLALSLPVHAELVEYVPPAENIITDCTSANFIIATTAFNNYIGYTVNGSALNTWKNYTALNSFLLNIVANQNVYGSLSGFATVCNAFEQLWGTLLPPAAKSSQCLTVENLVTNVGLNVDPVTAFAVVGLVNQYKFECGAGFYTLYRENLRCIQQVLNTQQAVFAQLLQTWQNNVQANPSKACDYMRDYSYSVGAVFNQSSCSYSNIDWWWGCEGALQFALTQIPSCRHERSCTINRNAFGVGAVEREVMEFAASVIKVEDGVRYFKMMDAVKNVNGVLVTEEGQWVRL